MGDINIVRIAGTVNTSTAELPADFFCIGSLSQIITTFHDIASNTIQCYGPGWTITHYNIIIAYTKN